MDHDKELAEELNAPGRAIVGRPTAYTAELAAEICEAVALGHPLQDLCDERAHWPARATIYRWQDQHPEFREMFKRARELKAHRFVDEMPDIAEGASAENVRVAELRIKTRQWIAGKLARDAYGDQAPTVAVQNNFNVTGIAADVANKLDQLAETAGPKVV
jgi:hypothetical protein